MNSVLLTAGVAAIILAVVGGGAQAFGVTVPVLNGIVRQAALGLAGAAFIAIAVATGHGNSGDGAKHRQASQIRSSLEFDMGKAVSDVLGTGVTVATGKAAGNTNTIFYGALSDWNGQNARITSRVHEYFSNAKLAGKPMPSAWSAYGQAVENLYYLSATEQAKAAHPNRCDRTRQLMTYMRGSAVNLMCPNTKWSPTRWGAECKMATTSWNALAICDENSVKNGEGYRRGPSFFEAYQGSVDKLKARGSVLLRVVGQATPTGF